MVKRKSAPKKAKPLTLEYKIGSKTFTVGNRILKEIAKLRRSIEPCIPRLPFSRLVREILLEHAKSDWRIQVEALKAIQEAAEIYLTMIFQDANMCASHARRITLLPRDMQLVIQLRGSSDPGYF